MEKKIGLGEFLQVECQMNMKDNTDSAEVIFPKDKEGKLLLEDISKVGGLDVWSGAKYIAFDALNNSEYSIALTLEFWDKGNESTTANLVSTIGILPGLKTRVSFPIEALNSQNMFLDRTPGKLKTVVHGNKVHELGRMAIGKKKFSSEQCLEISNVYLTDVEPEYPVPELKLVDEIGQWSLNNWPGKTDGIEELTTYMKAELNKPGAYDTFENWDEYGGWKDRKFEATGYFRTQKDGDRWWLVDPEGYVFFSVGIDCIGPGEGGNIQGIEKLFSWLPDKNGEYAAAWGRDGVIRNFPHFSFAIANLISSFGDKWEQCWSELTKRRLESWGVNTIGNWSSMDFIKYAKMPYVLPLRGFPETEKKIFRDFPDVFSEEYRTNSDIFASQLKGLENDKYMIGYFLRNEPTWAFINDLIIAEELLENKNDFYSKDVLVDFIRNKYDGDICKFNSAWRISLSTFDELKSGIREASKLSGEAEKDLREFSRKMIELYVKIPSEAVKRVDSNHMNLGMRYGYISSEEVLSGCECFDVFSVNCYDINPLDAVEKIGKLTGLPVIIGEYHFGGLDRGLSATGIRGVWNQEERGRAYRYYLENAASSKFCVGAHYFQYNDQPVLGRFDGENYQIGLVDVCNRPYEEFVSDITSCSKTIYEVAAGKIEKYNKEPDTIYPIFF